MNGIILHCGSEQVTREQVAAVPVPQSTRSYKPVPYAEAIDLMHLQAKQTLGLEVVSETYGLNVKGNQMFALMTLKTDREDSGLSIGLRQSYNKTLPLGVAVGSQVFVCDNLCFSGDAFKVVRKNTVNVWADFQRLLGEQMHNALGHYHNVNKDCDLLKATPCHQQRGFAMLGVAMGQELLTPNQASVAFQDWKTPRHEEFADRNMWGLYNAVTEGLKKGAPARIMERHTAAHKFFIDAVCN